jgi:Protein of unknown function (DUF2442)
MSRIHDIVAVEHLSGYRLRVEFDDGELRELDLDGQLDGPVFEPLRDRRLFGQVRVDPELGTVSWPTGADLDPIVVYECSPPLNAVAVTEPVR